MSNTPEGRQPAKHFSAEDVIFDANLQEFATRIGFLVGLEAQGKLAPDAAYDEIKKLYKQLKASKKGLGIGKPKQDESSTPDEPNE